MSQFNHRMIDGETGETIVESLQLANTFWSRFCGLQFRAPLDSNQGILLAPCSSIHTHWMRFPIAAIMLDRFGQVLVVHSEIVPWRMRSAPRGTRAVLETTTESTASKLQEGDRLRLVSTGSNVTVASIFEPKPVD